MNKLLKFRKRRVLLRDLGLIVVLAVPIGLALNFYLPEFFLAKTVRANVQTVKNENKVEGDIKGYAVVTDGDTIKINGIRIRFHGIDAPEIDQPCWRGNIQYQCGKVAKDYLSRLINNEPVTCQTLSIDKYGRKIAKCYNYKNQDIEALMVSSGMATAYLYYSQDYARHQEVAKKEKFGIWAGRFQEPYEFRKGKR